MAIPRAQVHHHAPASLRRSQIKSSIAVEVRRHDRVARDGIDVCHGNNFEAAVSTAKQQGDGPRLVYGRRGEINMPVAIEIARHQKAGIADRIIQRGREGNERRLSWSMVWLGDAERLQMR